MNIFSRNTKEKLSATVDEQELWEEAVKQSAVEPPLIQTRPMSQNLSAQPPVRPENVTAAPKRPKKMPSRDFDLSDLEDVVRVYLSLPPFFFTVQIVAIATLLVDVVGMRMGMVNLLTLFSVSLGAIALTIGALACQTRNLKRRNALFEVALPLGTTPTVLQFLLMIFQWIK